MDKVHFGIDSLVFRGQTIFGFGWLFHALEEVATLSLRLVSADCQEVYDISVEHGKPRSDVQDSYSASPHSLNSGFVVYGGCAKRIDQITRLSLVGNLASGDRFEVTVSSACLTNLDAPNACWSHALLLHRTKSFLRRGWSLIKQGQFAALSDKARRHLRANHRCSEVSVDAIVHGLTLGGPGKSVLVIDHDLGGGANQYRDGLVADRLSRGATVLVLSYQVATLNHMLLIYGRQPGRRYSIPGLSFVHDLAHRIRFDEVIYNTAVSFVRPEEIPDLIIALKAHHNPFVTMLLHDFFTVCPSHFLLNHQGVFCNLPEGKECRECLQKNQQGFATLFQLKNIEHWRASWGKALSAADRIVTFSNSSLQLLSRAYPQLDLSHAEILPHKVAHFRSEPLLPSDVTALRIGVVGHIAYHKGAKIVQDLAREIARRDTRIQIVVFGTLDANCPERVVTVTGSYKQAQLPELIRDHGVNTFLFPSICPETFSYVVQELMELHCPVACFDLGAPAERLRNYSKGLILREQGASVVLDALIEFHRKIYSLPTTRAIAAEDAA